MLTLVTSNTSKYQPFLKDLERMRITLDTPKRDLPELQSIDFEDALRAKARTMAEMFGHPVLVDDAGLVLEAYKPFPGPLTSVVLRSLGQAGLTRLMSGVTDRASMECHIGCWISGRLRSWSGNVQGRIDPTRRVRNERMMLTDIFVPDTPVADGFLGHRAQALAA
ncbi:MAG: non-canonical purine NTP pyrophosphatase, partial [Limisphaerales bacterium]